MPDGFMIVNADPRQWPDWEELAHGSEKEIVRHAFCEGDYHETFDKQDCTPEEFKHRLEILAFIWE